MKLIPSICTTDFTEGHYHNDNFFLIYCAASKSVKFAQIGANLCWAVQMTRHLPIRFHLNCKLPHIANSTVGVENVLCDSK